MNMAVSLAISVFLSTIIFTIADASIVALMGAFNAHLITTATIVKSDIIRQILAAVFHVI